MKKDGFALPLVLLVLFALELLTWASLTLATHEAAASAARERTTVAMRAAEASIRAAIRRWPLPGIDSLRAGQVLAFTDSAGTALTLRRNTAGQYSLTAVAASGRARVHATALLKTLDIDRAMTEASRAIVARNVLAAGTRFPPDTAVCAVPAAPMSVSDTLHLNDSTYAFAGLTWSELASMADSGLVYIDGSHIIGPGLQTGFVVVNGSVTLQTGADFRGIVVSRGAVQLQDGASLYGALLVRGDALVVAGAASITYSRCRVSLTLLQSNLTSRLARTQRRFIPHF
jgi:hypothetical protein